MLAVGRYQREQELEGSIEAHAYRRQLRWLGHVSRMLRGRLPRTQEILIHATWHRHLDYQLNSIDPKCSWEFVSSPRELVCLEGVYCCPSGMCVLCIDVWVCLCLAIQYCDSTGLNYLLSSVTLYFLFLFLLFLQILLILCMPTMVDIVLQDMFQLPKSLSMPLRTQHTSKSLDVRLSVRSTCGGYNYSR